MITEGNILVLTQWSFKDALVQTYTLPYVEMIRKIIDPARKIIVVTSEQPHLAMNHNEKQQLFLEWDKKNMELLAQQYSRFGFRKIFSALVQLYHLFRVIRKNKVTTIHAFCTPAGGMGYLLSKLTGCRLIVDSYEPHAEAMVENGTWKKKAAAFRILWWLEKAQTRKAYCLIATTAGMKQYALEKYGVAVKNFFVKPACVDLSKFSLPGKDPELLRELHLENKIVCVYAGKLGGIYYEQEVFDFIRACYDHWGDRFHFLMLTNAPKSQIGALLLKSRIPESILTSRFVLHQDIPRYLSLGDFAINPVKPVPTKRYCTSIKDGEYWAMGLPVVISPGISDDSEIIRKNGIGVVIDFSDISQLKKTIPEIENLIQKPEIKQFARKIAAGFRSYKLAENIYKILY